MLMTVQIEPTLPELLHRMQIAGGHFGNMTRGARAEASANMTTARLAYHVAKVLDESEAPISQAQADYICQIMNSRVAAHADGSTNG